MPAAGGMQGDSSYIHKLAAASLPEATLEPPEELPDPVAIFSAGGTLSSRIERSSGFWWAVGILCGSELPQETASPCDKEGSGWPNGIPKPNRTFGIADPVDWPALEHLGSNNFIFPSTELFIHF